MKTLRTAILGFLTGALMAFALPASAAPEKIFSLNMSPTNVAAGVGIPLTATLRNETPSGNSSINSAVINAPSGYTITAVGTPPSGTAVVAAGGGSVSVSNMSPLKPGKTFALALTVTITAGSANSCTQVTSTWGAQSWTGSSFSGDTFRLLDPPETSANRTTSVTPVCNYRLTGLPATIPAGTSATVSVTLKNESPLGNPSITSLALTAPAGLTITSANPVSVNVGPTLSTTISVTISASCGAAGGAWGSSANGGAFTRVNTLPTLSATPACKLVVQQPQNVVTGVPFSLEVKALDGSGGVYTPFTGPVTLTRSDSGILGGGGTLSGSGGIVTYSAVTITGVGQYTLTAASSFGTASVSVSTLPFTVYEGDLNCSDPLDPLFTMPGGAVSLTSPGYAAGTRGAYNKDGSPCIKVAYDFTNDILTTNSVRLRWDTTAQPGASFIYTMTWQDEVPDLTAGVPTRRTKVAWQFDPSTGAPLYTVFGVSCVGASLPAPYGSLATGVDAVQTTITVTAPGPLPAVPFPAAIGSERIQVTAVTGSNWTVVRGAGNLGADAALHSPGAAVMSTPLPIDPNQYLPVTLTVPANTANPYYNRQAQMCIADEGWVSVGGGKVRFTTTIFDIGDGAVSRDF